MNDTLSPIDDKKELTDALEDVILSDEQKNEIVLAATVGTIADHIPIISSLVDWVDRVNRAEHEKRVELLLKEYVSYFADIQDAVSRLKFLTSTSGGQTLFRKIIQILNNGVGNDEWVSLLARTLKRIADSSIGEQFEKILYIIAQIDKLSPHCLILISRFDIWKKGDIQGTTTTSDQTLRGDWDQQIAGFFAREVGITDSEVILRLKHSFRELENMGMIVLTGRKVGFTPIGYDVYSLISSNSP